MKNANIKNPAGDPPRADVHGTLPVSAGKPEDAAAQEPAGRRIIVTDTSGSMGGDAWYM